MTTSASSLRTARQDCHVPIRTCGIEAEELGTAEISPKWRMTSCGRRQGPISDNFRHRPKMGPRPPFFKEIHIVLVITANQIERDLTYLIISSTRKAKVIPTFGMRCL